MKVRISKFIKNICFVVQNIYDCDVRVKRKAEALVAAGYSVDVLALRPAHGPKSYSLGGVNVRTISLSKKRGTLARYFFEYVTFFLWVFVWTSIRMLRKRYALIDISTLPDFLVLAPLPAKLMGAKLILDMHELAPEFYMSKYGSSESSWAVRMLKYLEKFSTAFADHVLTINDPVQNLLASRGLPPWKSTVIMNSADETRFSGVNVERPTAPHPKEDGTFVMMYHGTLTRIYGVDIAIEAFSLAQREMPGAEFWILGSGPEKDSLVQLTRTQKLSSKVRFFGQRPSSEIYHWLSMCDLGILPIRRDIFLDFAFPNKLTELIVMEKGVIVSGLNAIRCYFSDDALAYFEPNNAADLARQMVRVFKDPGLRTRLASKAREEYARINWATMKKRYLALVNRMVQTGTESSERSRPSPASYPG